jgi:flagellar protein FlaI
VTNHPVGGGPLAAVLGAPEKVFVRDEEFETLVHILRRDNVGYGAIDSLLNDLYVEDITNRGTQVFVVHKIFGNMETDIFFDNPESVDRYMIQLAERMDQRISAAMPVAEGALPNGARVIIIYGELVSRNGSTFSLRRPDAIPLSIIDLIAQNVLSAAAGAYFWMCIENGMSLFICGESACGKTTLMKGLGAFIKPGSKVYSIEKTPEIWVPHGNWQATLEKEGRASNFDLLKASLRSRPDYIIMGQILGKEGSIVFQAMQTGHPVMSTFHGSSLNKIIQRLSGTPINIPKPFIDNLNIVVIMQNTFRGDEFVRRVTEIDELEGYFEAGGVLTRTIFTWDQHTDEHEFKGYLNSYILENKVGALKGYADKRDIYKELDKRTEIIKKMVEKHIVDYQNVYDIMGGYVKFGNSRLPFFVEG